MAKKKSAAKANVQNQAPFIVGIGASAGGLKPLQEFFGSMPQDSGLAFVIVQHLSPEFKSLMGELLSRHTKMACHRVEHGMPLEPDSIYLIPPKKNLAISDDKLFLTDQDLTRGHPVNFPIDIFLNSLASSLGERAVGVILSGTGSDGTRGVRSINEAGGVVLVQDPESAEFDGMPRSVIATGLADYVLPPRELAHAIYDYATNAPGGVIQTAADETPSEVILHKITAIVAREQQIDFSHYRPSTLGRRIERRRVISGCDSAETYVELLEASEEERAALRKDLLINVTAFFRDTEAWTFLEWEIVPRLIAQTKDSDELRIWITACSTGEEAYSLAMLVQEALDTAGRSLDVKIFATDIDGEALQKAAAGVFAEGIIEDVSPQRVARFFKKRGRDYHVIRQLREMMIFAAHNVTRDPPFTRMHLVTCRNLLIYMQPQLQQQVLSTLHFALQVKGVLFLGSAETVGDLQEEFTTLQQKWKMFEKNREVRLPLSMVGGLSPRPLPTSPLAGEAADAGLGLRLESMTAEAFGATLRHQQSICVLVSAKNEVQQVIGDPSLFLRVPEGKSPLDVTKMVSKSLALPLGTALNRARLQNVPVSYSSVKVDDHYVDLLVTHHAGGKTWPEFLMILLKQTGAAVSGTDDEFDPDSQAAQRIGDLEVDLQQTKENLQATIEELETTNEEQQATNQELLASNEELQSTNEELQSVNEELYSVNAEFQSKIGELTGLNNDIDNLLHSTDIGTVFLDKQLRIRKFTPAVTSVIKLVEHDIGRPLDQISYGIEMGHDELLDQVRHVLDSGKHAECEVQSSIGASLLLRIDPYRDEAGRTDGVVLTFVDVSALKRAELQSRLLQTLMHAISTSVDFVTAMERTLSNVCQTFGWDYAEAWLPRSDDGVLECCSTYVASPELEPFREIRGQLQLSANVGLPGRVWSSKEPQWILNLAQEPDLIHHAESAADVGLTAGMSVPIVMPPPRGLKSALGMSILAENAVEVILTFFMRSKPRKRDLKAAVDLLSPVGMQLGTVVHRKRLDMSLREAYEELQLKNQELEQFVHTVSHDLKSPLVTIGGVLGLLKEELHDGRLVEAGEILATGEDTVARMQGLIEDLLKLSRSGRMVSDLQPVELRPVIEELIRSHQAEIDEQHATVELTLDATSVPADRNRLAETLDNLLVNALKYTCDGREPRIEIGSQTADGEVRLFVQDNGPGIEPQQHENIFGLFQQLDATCEGSGVGLAIVRRIMEVHHGRTWVESTPGEGATFWLAFPAQVGEALLMA